MAGTDTDPLQDTLSGLHIPAEFARYDTVSEPEAIIRLEEWKQQISAVLDDLRTRVASRIESLSLEEKAHMVSKTAPFDAEAPWAVEPARKVAQDILRPHIPPDVPLLDHILSYHVKPVFQLHPHPSLNLSTGRLLPRTAGGPLAHLDQYEGQAWKAHPGVIPLISWCVRYSETAVYERLWHLLIPPIMTLLDDYEASYKLKGIQIVSDMLRKVPADLLRRTGVDGLLFSSLKTCLTYLHNPETPSLIRAAIPTAITLALLTTTPGSEKRFNQLCAILGDGIIGSIWMYATRESDAIEASVDVLPGIVKALNIGTVRYLKAIVPQLVFPLLLENAATKHFQFSSLCALSVVIQTCAPRMHQWKDTVLNGTVKCWVTLIDSGAEDDETAQLKHALRDVCIHLREACPSVADAEYARLLQLDEQMFGPLLRPSGESDR